MGQLEVKILITGANGFIGKNLTVELKNQGYKTLFLCDQETTVQELKEFTRQCDFVFHLAVVNGLAYFFYSGGIG